LVDYPLQDLKTLALQRGFAGHVVLDGEQCTWIRYIDYQPDTGRPDTGRLRSDGDLLYERGAASSVLGEDYEETYLREAQGSDRLVALRERRAAPSDSTAVGAILLIIDERFLFARPRAVPLPPAQALAELIERDGLDTGSIHAYFDCEISLGHVDRDHRRSWTIDLSTIPFREGQALFPPLSATLQGDVLSLESHGATLDWRIVECNLSDDALVELFHERHDAGAAA
jgi:hypothetical protein